TASAPAGTPRKLIWVRGEASRLPGSGETVTAPASRAELLSLAGAHRVPAREASAGGLAVEPSSASASMAASGAAIAVRSTAIDASVTAAAVGLAGSRSAAEGGRRAEHGPGAIERLHGHVSAPQRDLDRCLESPLWPAQERPQRVRGLAPQYPPRGHVRGSVPACREHQRARAQRPCGERGSATRPSAPARERCGEVLHVLAEGGVEQDATGGAELREAGQP